MISKSPFNWAGSKNKALSHVLPVINQFDFKVFAEPFVGAANVSLNVDAEKYYWNDLNKDLINSYNVLLSKHTQEYYSYLHWCDVYFKTGFKDYYDLRDQFNQMDYKQNIIQKAALFQYLNKHGFNGLCRYNQKGMFNVPRGTVTKKRKVVPEEQCYNLRERHKNNTFLFYDEFREHFKFLNNSREDAMVVYCDPPYVALTSDFKYTKDGFNCTDQEDLKRLSKESKHICLISNHWTEYTENLYSDADEIHVFDVQRTISCKGEGRKKVQECLVVYY